MRFDRLLYYQFLYMLSGKTRCSPVHVHVRAGPAAQHECALTWVGVRNEGVLRSLMMRAARLK